MIECEIAAADPSFQITHLDIPRHGTSFMSEDTYPLTFPFLPHSEAGGGESSSVSDQQGTGPQSGFISSACL